MEEKSLHAEGAGAEKSSRFQTRRDSNKSSVVRAFANFDLNKLKGRNTFCSAEKLKSKKVIEHLFKEGKSVSNNGFTLVYLSGPLNTMYPAQAGFTVPKKFFKHAVDRNRIKRLMREAYRLNKYSLYEKLVERKQQIALMFVFKGKALPVADDTSKAVVMCMNKIIR